MKPSYTADRTLSDQFEQELARLAQAANIVVLPSAIRPFAQKRRSSRAKLHMALHLLDDLGELCRLIREIIDTITLVAEGRYRRPPRQDGGVFEIAI